MGKIFIYIIVISLTLAACSPRLAGSGEAPLFPDKSEGKWWIVNTITKDLQGKNYHRCLLLSTENMNEKKIVSFFTSQWTESAAVFYSGTESSANASLKTKLTFPLDIDILPYNFWSWQLKRNKMTITTMLRKNNTDSSEAHTAVFRFKKQRPFTLSKMMKSPDIWTVSPIAIKDKPDGAVISKSDGCMFISVISGKEVFFNTSKNKTVVWMNILMTSGKKMNFLLTVTNDGAVTINSFFEWNKMNDRISDNLFEISSIGEAFSAGNITGKKYPLFYRVYDKEENISYFLKPVIKEQEQAANKSSFWMGAIEVVDSLNEKRIGAGNMYIFRQ